MSSSLYTTSDNSYGFQKQSYSSRMKKYLYENYYQNPFNNKSMDSFYPINNTFKDIVIDDINKIFIYIFYYEKALLSSPKMTCFKEYKNYFLINPEWLENYKNAYHYNELYKILEDFSKYNYTINYNNLEGHILTILYSKKDCLKKIKSEKEIIKHDIIPKSFSINNITFYENCFIIDEKIIDMINVYHFKGKIQKFPIKIKVKNNYIYLIDALSISIGSINNKLVFVPIYLLFYENLIISDAEKDLLFSNTIKDYIRLRKCSEIYNKIQTLIKEKNEQIGNMIVLKIGEFKPNKLTDNNKLENILKEKAETLEKKYNVKKVYFKRNIKNNNERHNYNLPEQIPQRFEELEKELQKSNEKIRKLEQDIKEKENELYNLRNKNSDYKKILDRKNSNNEYVLDNAKLKLKEFEKEKKNKDDALLYIKKFIEENKKEIDNLNESNKQKELKEKEEYDEENKNIIDENKKSENEKKLKDKLFKDNKELKQNEKVYQDKIKEYEKKNKKKRKKKQKKKN